MGLIKLAWYTFFILTAIGGVVYYPDQAMVVLGYAWKLTLLVAKTVAKYGLMALEHILKWAVGG